MRARDLPTEQSLVVGPTQLGRMMGRSRDWGRAVIARWREEQERGGARRVHQDTVGGRLTWCTTVGVVHREFGTRDYPLERRIKQLDKDLEFATRRIDALTARIGVLEAQMLRQRTEHRRPSL